MSRSFGVGLPEALERAASALPEHADAIRPANGDPAQLGASLDAPAAAAVLAWLLANEPEDGAELAHAWAEDPAVGAGPLLAVDEAALPKAGRKALRRALHQLRSRGVAVAAREREAVVATLPPVEEGLEEGRVSPLDPQGARVVYLAVTNPAGGARVFEVVIDEARGVVAFEVYSAGRGKVRKFLRDLGERGRFAAVPAPSDAVRALVARAAAAQPTDRPLPRAFREWEGHIAEAPEGALVPGERVRAELGAPDDEDAALERAVALVRTLEVGPWPPVGDALQKIAEELAEVAKGKIIVSGARKREQADGVISAGLAELYGEPRGEQTARRFEESAFVLWKRGRPEDARACLAAATAFRTRAPDEQPVARTLLEVVLAPVLARLEDENEAGGEEPLVVKP